MFCCFWTDLVSVWTARGIRSKKIVIHSNSSGYLFGKNCCLFEQLGLSIPKKINVIRLNGLGWPFGKIVICSNGLGYPFQKIVIRLNGLGYPFQKIVIHSDARAIRLKKKLLTVGGTEPVCSKINFSRISIPKPFHLKPIMSNDLLFSRSHMLRSLLTNLSWMIMDLCSFVAIFAFI